MHVTRFCAHMRYRNLAAKTIQRRKETLATLAKFLDPTPLADATTDDLEAFLASRRAAATRNAYRSDMRAFYGWLRDKAIIETSPAHTLARITVPKALPRPLTVASVEGAMLAATGSTRRMISLALYAGMRCCEIATLNSEDVWAHGQPPVIVVRNGKGRKDRSVPMHPALVAEFSSLPATGPVFAGRVGPHIRPRSVSARINKHLRSCGIDGTAHQLRHTFGTEAAAVSGGDVIAVAELMGHDSTNTTMGYIRLTAGRAAALVQAMYQPAAVA